MKTYRSRKGPFATRPYYTTSEIEAICTDELLSVGLLPSFPEPIRIDRFIEKRFGITHEYEELPESVLGFSIFGPEGVESIVVAQFLDEDGSKSADRRIRTTLAHESGHVLLQGHLFALGKEAQSLFGDSIVMDKPKVLCREMPGLATSGQKKYDGRWWEFQANSAIGALLLPRMLVQKALDSILVSRGLLGAKVLEAERREEAIYQLTEVFDVNPAVARIRLDEVFPATDEKQLTL
jgi:hypothetical protein